MPKRCEPTQRVDPPALPTIPAYLEHYAESIPDEELVAHGDRRLSYAEGLHEVRRLAAALTELGVEHGDRVAVYGNPHIDCYLIFLACASLGAVFVGLNPKQREQELRHVLATSMPRLLFVVGEHDAEHHRKVARVHAELGKPFEVIACAVPGVCRFDSIAAMTAAALERRTVHRHPQAPVRAEDPAAMVFTSGSSGAPKAALLPHGPMMLAYAEQARHWYARRPVGVADLPINHLGFVGDNCMTLMVAGGTVHVIERWTPEAILELIETEKLNFWWTQTTMLLLATRSERWRQADLSSLQLIAYGGAPVSPAMIEALLEKEIPLGTGYGMTEVHGNITYADRDASVEVLSNTVGKPLPNFEVEIVDADGRSCGTDEVGEVVVRSETLFAGYRDREGKVDRARDEQGWYHTKDLALRRADGNFVLAGRVDHMFKSGGYNVYPREVELALQRHPAVAMAVVVAVEDPTWAQVGHAYVVAADDRELSEEELRAYAKEHLANYKVPKRFFLCRELPMLASGKVDVKALCDRSRAAIA